MGRVRRGSRGMHLLGWRCSGISPAIGLTLSLTFLYLLILNGGSDSESESSDSIGSGIESSELKHLSQSDSDLFVVEGEMGLIQIFTVLGMSFLSKQSSHSESESSRERGEVEFLLFLIGW